MGARLANYLGAETRGHRRMRPALVSALTGENLVHSCVIERRAQEEAGSPAPEPQFDPHGAPLMGDYAPTLSPPVTGAAVRTDCFAWRVPIVGEFGDEARAGVVHQWRLLLPAGTALAEDDAITDVRDEDNAVLDAGPLNVTEVATRRGHVLALAGVVTSGRSDQ